MTDARKSWVDALRSGDFPQGRKALYRDGLYCCLGVACAVLECHMPKGAHLGGYPEVMRTLGLTDSHGAFSEAIILPQTYAFPERRINRLVELNDEAAWSFDQIADFIESNPAGLFTN